MLVRTIISAGGQRVWPGRHNASTRYNWSATLAIATSEAAFWACQEWDSIVACSTNDSDGGHGRASGDSGLQQTVHQRQRQQRYLCLQQVALELGKAVQLLLLPDATTGSLDALEQKWVPKLLMALAMMCCLSPDALEQYLQVRMGHVIHCRIPCLVGSACSVLASYASGAMHISPLAYQWPWL